MLAIIADTYMEPYGSTNYLFGVYESENECIDFMNNYNKKVLEFFDEYQQIGKEPEAVWETDEDDLDADPVNISEINEYRDRVNKIIKKYSDQGIIIGDIFYYNDGSNLNDIFRFNLDKYKNYIKNLENSKPIYIGGYCE